MSSERSYHWPGGHSSFVGGPRNEVKLERPWQTKIEIDPTKCPFCSKLDRHIVVEESGDWKVLKNQLTAFTEFHRLVIPSSCWEDEKLRFLGGLKKVNEAFQVIDRQLSFHSDPLLLNLHVGVVAGQSLSHLHYHVVRYILSPETVPDSSDAWRKVIDSEPHLVISDDEKMIISVGGLRTAQCVFVPTNYNSQVSAVDVASRLFNTISVYNSCFRNPQGLAPDFKVSFKFHQQKLLWGYYIPILGFWGAAEEMALYEPGIDISLAWSHEKTAAHIKGNLAKVNYPGD